jgi:hypothetical protein
MFGRRGRLDWVLKKPDLYPRRHLGVMGVGWQRQGNTAILEWLWTAEGEGGGRRYQGVATDLVDK